MRTVIVLLSVRRGFALFLLAMGWPAAADVRTLDEVIRDADLMRGHTSLLDVLDRVLDKGIVIDGWGRVSVIGIDLINIDAWVVVASIHTYLRYAESLGLNPRIAASRPTAESLS